MVMFDAYAGQSIEEVKTTCRAHARLICEAEGYAQRLAEALHDKHYADYPQWKPIEGNLLSLLAQIDDMTTGLARVPNRDAQQMTDWQPPSEARVVIVCAACRHGDFVAAGPRHFDGTMQKQVESYVQAHGGDWSQVGGWEQGFIDQWGRFYSREEAMGIVKANGQPFDAERNCGNGTELFSEGLY